MIMQASQNWKASAKALENVSFLVSVSGNWTFFNFLSIDFLLAMQISCILKKNILSLEPEGYLLLSPL